MMNAGQGVEQLLKLRKEDLEKLTMEQLIEVVQLALDAQANAINTIAKAVATIKQLESERQSLQAKIIALGGKP